MTLKETGCQPEFENLNTLKVCREIPAEPERFETPKEFNVKASID